MFKDFVKHSTILSLSAALLITAGCSSKDANENLIISGNIAIEDPYEEYNRDVFEFNDALDEAILAPAARTYRDVVPEPAQDGLRNALRNLKSPINIANQVLQGDFEGTLTDVMRAMVNTTFGFLGIVDLAQSAGLEYEKEDFGQTLAVWGIDHGPYIVVPIIGPSSLRDHIGNAVDSIADPLRIYLFNIDEEGWSLARTGATLFDGRVQLLDILADLKKNSFDYYAAVRSSYYQRRQALVDDQNPRNANVNELPEIPDYDDEFGDF